MPDTYRSRSQLVGDLADNTTGQITPQDLRNLLYSTIVVDGGGNASVGGGSTGVAVAGGSLGGGVDGTVWADSGGYAGYNPNDSITSLKPSTSHSHADSGGSCFGPNSHANTGGQAEGNTTFAAIGGATCASAQNAFVVGAYTACENVVALNTNGGLGAAQAWASHAIAIGDSSATAGWITSNYSAVLGIDCQAGPNIAALDEVGGCWAGSPGDPATVITFLNQDVTAQFPGGSICILTYGAPSAARTLNAKQIQLTDTGSIVGAWTGAYDSGATYNSNAGTNGNQNDCVSSGGVAYCYIYATNGTAPAPPNATYWLPLPDTVANYSANVGGAGYGGAGPITILQATAGFADYNCAGGGESSDLINIGQFSNHFACGIGCTATDDSQANGSSMCGAFGINIANPNAESCVFGCASSSGSGGLNAPRGALACSPSGVQVSSKVARVGGVIADYYADAGSPASTVETSLFSTTFGSYGTAGNVGLLDTNGDKIVARYAGVLVNHSGTNTNDVKLYFGSQLLLDTGAMTMTGAGNFDISLLLTRVSSTSFRYAVTCALGGTSTVIAPKYGLVTGLSPNLNNAQTLKLTGTAGGSGYAANDIVAKIGYVEWKGAA